MKKDEKKISLSNIKGMLNREGMKKITGGGACQQSSPFCERCRKPPIDGFCVTGSPGGINGNCYCA
jgi:hypothetical protein